MSDVVDGFANMSSTTCTKNGQRARKRRHDASGTENEGSPSISLKINNACADEKPSVCKYCEKSFRKTSTKNIHERTHTGEKPYSCRFCEKCFTTGTERKRHERAHTGERPYRCSYCENSFRRSSEKQAHELIHKGEKPYRCSYCEKSFRRNTLRKLHELTHAGVKPHACQYCGKTFARACRKTKHELTHTDGKIHRRSANSDEAKIGEGPVAVVVERGRPEKAEESLTMFALAHCETVLGNQ